MFRNTWRESAKERKMMARFRCRNEEREREQVLNGRRRRCEPWSGCGEMREREGKERREILRLRRKGDRIDERDMEDEGKDREREG
jgi:hypothetical protein